ncbi:MAG: MATE family efflux transporter [Candidatus Diapherotrites archaeon]|nr:MATE family efflux transporter [Candidatus Diapherotrites archaeon]
MEGQDLTKGNIRKQLWSLAWPLMLSVFFYTLYNIVDAFWVSKLSPEAIAAVSIAQIALFIMISLSFGLAVGSGVIMAMHIGAKNTHEAERVLGQSFVLAAIVGVIFTAIALLFRTELLTLSGATGAIFAPAMEYFIVTAGGSILFFILIAIMFAFNSEGDTFTLTKLFAVSTFVNVVLDPVFIFGGFGVPAMGISGAAIATLISQAVFIVLAMRKLSSKHRKIRFHFHNLSFNLESVKKILGIGIPASLTQVINPIGMAGLMFITSLAFLELGVIAFSIGFRIDFFAFLPAVGFGFGALAMIGQNLGAGNIGRAKESFKKALKYSFVGATAIGVLALAFGHVIVGIFTTDALVTEHAISYIMTISLSYGFLAIAMVQASAFQAIGKSWPGFWIFFLKFIVISIPLAYFMTQVLDFSIVGIWIAIIAGNIAAAAVGYFWITSAMNKISPENIPVHHMEAIVENKAKEEEMAV